jgi:2-methylisocitrate lyase-like PEP mutase family enzyme
MPSNDPTSRRSRFFALHARPGVFVMPNPWDVGSAVLLEHAGFEALATTSAGFAWSQGRDDYGVTLDELVDHVGRVAAAVDVPLNVDGERLFADTLDGVGATVRLLHEAGAAGCSIEDWDPATGRIDPIGLATERVAAAAEAAHREPGDPLLLTARCENPLHGVTDLDDTINRLVAYRDAGADCVYAPGLTTTEQIADIVDAVGVPVNVLAMPGGPSVAQIGAAGGRRVSVGSSLASTAYGALMAGARELREHGTSEYLTLALGREDRAGLRR